ncbi:hypothetical protein [Reyranella sp.]|uniref:hypothetical protein n=1 Tax=Reyranella sp. TaxID=1929291 RepID=UPI0025D82A45|nr:hypothetical protein [Reyranella sp.]
MLARSALALIVTGIAVELMGVASALAQTSTVPYCQALAEKYQRYVATDGADLGRPRGAPQLSYAITRCNMGDSAASTPILEKALTDAKIALPPQR